MVDSLSVKQARKLVLLSQKLPPAKQSGTAISATLAAIEHLGYIQIDTISVIERAHHHTLWNRNQRYQPKQLDDLIAQKKVFEYWSHAAAYLPMCHYRYSLPRKQAFLNGEQKHWFDPDEKLMTLVKDRIKAEGPLMAKDFDDKTGKLGEWKSKPSKQALETLFMQGDLMISSRKKFHKVYDLTERVVPEGTDISVPSVEEQTRFLIKQYLLANGVGQAAEMAYLLKNTKPLVTKTLQEMTLSGELLELKVVGDTYYALPESMALLDKPLARSKLKILSPFDNLLIQRKRMKALFDFDYLIECYVPEAKRQYGYFSLPILWDGKLIARMDCKVDRKTSILHINHLAMESSKIKQEAFSIALLKELESFMIFNGCESFQLHRTTPSNLKQGFNLTTNTS